jgi:hypothetical protein
VLMKVTKGIACVGWLLIFSAHLLAQETTSPAPNPPNQTQSTQSEAQDKTKPTTPAGVSIQEVPVSKQQPKRILGMMPNYRAVSAGAIPPPPTPKQAFKIATLNSFDYSSFVFVGITSGLAFWTEAHPDLGEDGIPALWGYCWRGFVDKASGNYMVIFALPTILHEDERYYAMGEGNFYKRGVYAASRILITPNYRGHNTFNAAEVFGRAASQGISLSYYPKGDHTAGALAVKFGWAMGRDALTNVFREYWPDIATHVLHRHP